MRFSDLFENDDKFAEVNHDSKQQQLAYLENQIAALKHMMYQVLPARIRKMYKRGIVISNDEFTKVQNQSDYMPVRGGPLGRSIGYFVDRDDPEKVALTNKWSKEMDDVYKRFFFLNHQAAELKVKGKTFYFAFSGVHIDAIQSQIRRLGGVITPQIDDNLDYLVVLDKDSNSSNAKRARMVRARLITKEELIELIS